VSTSSDALRDVASVNDFLNAAATETVPLFKHLEFEFLLTTTCSPPLAGGEHECISHRISFATFCTATTENVYGTRSVTREFQHSIIWYYCGLDKPPSRDTTDRFLTDLEYVVDDIFDELVKKAALRGLLDSTYSIDSTHIEAIQYTDAAS